MTPFRAHVSLGSPTTGLWPQHPPGVCFPGVSTGLGYLHPPVEIPYPPCGSHPPYAPSSGTLGQACHIRGGGSTLFPSTYLCCAKEQWKAALHYRPPLSKSVHSLSLVQHDQSCHTIQDISTPSMGNLPRPNRCLPTCSYTEEPSQIPHLLGELPPVFLQGSSIRPQCSPTNIHHTMQTPSSRSQISGDSHFSVPGRLVHLGGVSLACSLSHLSGSSPPGASGIPNQSKEVLPHAQPANNLAWGSMGSQARPLGYTSGTEASCPGEGTQAPYDPSHLQTPNRVPPRFSGVYSSNSVAYQIRPRSLSPHSEILPSRPPRSHSLPLSSHSPNFHNVGELPVAFTSVIRPLSPHIRSLDRRQPGRVGCIQQPGNLSLGNVGPSRTRSSYQHSRAEGNTLSPSTPTITRCNNKSARRQFHSQVGAEKEVHFVPSITASPSGAAGSPRQQPDNGHNSLCPDSPQHPSRCTQQSGASGHRVDTTPTNISEINSLEGRDAGRPDGNSTECPTFHVRIPVPTSQGSSGGCVHDRLEQMDAGLFVPASQMLSPTDAKDNVLQRARRRSRPLATHRGVVSRALRTLRQNLRSRYRRFSTGARQYKVERLQELRQMDRLQFLRKCLSKRMEPSEVDTVLAAHRPSSIRQMNTAWKKFQRWLPPEISVLQKKHVLKFLNELAPLKPHTIECYRNSLKSPLMEGFNINCSEEDFKLLSKGQFNLNPPAPKRVPSWSLNQALETIANPSSSSLIKHFHLLRALFLVALASSNRVSDLAHAVRDPIQLEGRVVINTRPGYLLKNQSANHCPGPISFPHLDSQHPLCPAQALREYLASSNTASHENSLFVHPATGKPLTSGRLNYWLALAIKTFDMSKDGLSHDMRKAGTSLAFFRGIPLADIVQAGFWRSPNVFIRNYLFDVDIPNRSCVAARRFIDFPSAR